MPDTPANATSPAAGPQSHGSATSPAAGPQSHGSATSPAAGPQSHGSASWPLVEADLPVVADPNYCIEAVAEWGEECATCGVKPRREDDIFCSDECARADWASVGGEPDPYEEYDREGLFS